jgi:hypothetical protein
MSVRITGCLIPQVDIGLSSFGGIASSTVLDASMDLSVSASSASLVDTQAWTRARNWP